MNRSTRPRALAHAGFTLVREYPVPVKEVWSAFAEESQKRAWFGQGDAWSLDEWRFDFRVGGSDVAEGEFHGGPVSRYVATYTDIVEHERFVTTYDMWIDGAHISTSVASYEFESTPAGARLTHAEHGVHLDGFDTGEQRRIGTAELLESLGRHLTGDR